MFCPNCGMEITQGAKFCKGCGTPVAGGPDGPGIKKTSTPWFVGPIIMIAIGLPVLGILIAIAVPGFIKARHEARRRMCLDNLSKIDHAKLQYVLSNNVTNGYEPTWDELIVPANVGYLRSKPVCPDGGQYKINEAGTPPMCSLGFTKNHKTW